ncbi:MAG: Rpp14/Pop5 family protein [Candidatus ainarchaeum sp.]|nr:Rpp14/Pop5 family protein [Candidatus ainarchaeum sp.]
MQKQIPRIKPSQRPKKRYVLFELKTSQKFSFSELSKQLWLAIVKQTGKEEALSFGFQLVVFDFKIGRGIFKCRREKCEKAKKAVNSIREFYNAKVFLKTLRTSGTIKTLKELLQA